jgi:hypothetical protein
MDMGTNVLSTDFITTAEAVQVHREGRSSGVSWGAVIGGAFVASAVYLILLALGAGFELSTISPWSGMNGSTAAVGVGAIIWLFVIEIVASGFGGYLTGRLRTKWTSIRDEEVYFRDTANGFLSWSVALIASAAFLAAAGTAMTGNSMTMDDPSRAMLSGPVNMLFQSDRPIVEPNDMNIRAEAAGVLGNSLRQNEMSSAEQNYLARLVAVETGLSQADANTRVMAAYNDAKQMADKARKGTAHFLLWLFLTLLLGAFSASFAATVGGKQRDLAHAL